MRLTTKIILLVSFVVAISLVVTAVGMSNYIEGTIKENLGNSSMNVARSVANNQAIIEAMELGDRQSVQEMAERIRTTTGSTYIVIFDTQGSRFSHPVAELVGQPIQGGDEGMALQGQEYFSHSVGTFGESLRAFTPIHSQNGQIIGGVVVGVLMENLQAAVWQSRKFVFAVMIFGLLIGAIGSYFLARNIKQGLFGLEPEQIAKILEERNAVLQGIKEGVIAINREGLITLVNEASLQLLGAGDYLGKPVEELVPNTRLNEVIKTGCPEYNQVQDLQGKRIVTNRIPILVRGQVVGAVATFRDITEMKELADELTGIRTYTEALRAQAHEFMNKLHVVWGLVKLECYSEATDYIRSIVSHAETEAEFVISRIKNPAVAGLLIAKFSTMREAGTSLCIDPESTLAEKTCLVNAELITILGNLLDNAIEAVRFQDKREVHLFLQGDETELMLEICDSGQGIEADVSQQIFDWGFSTKGGQRGVGLFLVDEIVKKYNGVLEFANTDFGCVFTVHLGGK
ncbi:MAG: DcuS/MalK family sensor histidine kinase [Sporomusaceae bacterium]|nr:DcuS/MalK family sensor histidine kinase [Sporomusaceae bacterium]